MCKLAPNIVRMIIYNAGQASANIIIYRHWSASVQYATKQKKT